MTGGLRVWMMQTAGLAEADVAPWLAILDEAEQARAARFMFGRHRTTFIAAHALVRFVLSRMDPSHQPAAWRFVPGPHGKPTAWAAGLPAPLTFNLSHTEGLVGLATLPSPGHELGFDVEPMDRKVNLDVADRFFRPEETAWLQSLPEAGRAEGFLRLWTLKEAFIKATGEGLARDLASFWFSLPPPVISFAGGATEAASGWWFDQRVVGGRFLAAVGLRAASAFSSRPEWTEIEPAALAAA